MLMKFSGGLLKDMRVNPSTGTLWDSFESKATYIIAHQSTVQNAGGNDNTYAAKARYESQYNEV
jgi:hypothetical protein